MAKSKINVRFIAIFSAIVVLGIAFAGFVIWWQKVAGPERNFATAERYEQAGDYRKAASFLGRAVNKQQTNVKYLDAYEAALQRIVPTTVDEAREFYNQLVGVRLQRARATPSEAAPWLRAMETLYERDNAFRIDVLWREFGEQAQQISERLSPQDPAQNRLKYWKAIAITRRGATVTDAERAEAEKLLQEVVATDPAFDAAWLDLMQSQLDGAEKMRADRRDADARARTTELEATIAAAKKAVPQGISWRIATLERMRGQVDRREPGVDAEAMEAARQELLAIAPSVSNSREQTFLIANQLLNARNNDWLRRVLEMLKARIQKDPNDMIARRIYMQAATMIDPASAKVMADETQQIPNLPVSLEALVQEETRVAAVTSLFNAQFEEWRAAKDLESRNALLPKLQAVRDNAVKMLQPIGERGQAQLIEAKTAIAEGRMAEAVVTLDAVIKSQTNPPPDAYLYAAFANLFRKETGTAMRIATEGLERFPNYTPLLAIRGDIEASVGKYEQAARTYQRVLELEPGNKLASEGLRAVAGMTNTAAEAAVANKGDAVGVAMGTAERQLLRQDLDGAERTLTEALAKSPNDMRLIMAMAQLYATVRNDPKVANEWIDKGLAIAPNEERLLQFRAVLSSKDPYERAIEVVRLQYTDPKLSAIYKYLTLADLQDRLTEMLARPGMTESEQTLLKKSQERTIAALPEALEAALKAAPGEEMVLERATLSAINRSDWGAIERYASSAETSGERALAATLRSRSLLAQNKLDASMQVLLDAEKAGERSPTLLRQISLMYERSGKLDEAKEAMQAAYERRPNDVVTARLYAQLLDRGGERTRALEILRELSRANPTNRDVMNAWLGIESEVGDRTGAVAMRRRLYKEMPGFKENSIELARVLLNSPADLELMIDAEGKRKFSSDQLQAMTPLKRQQELQAAAQGNLNLGLEIVELLQSADPSDASLALMKARARARFGKDKDGEDSLRADIAKAGPANSKLLWVSLGALQAESGRPELAVESFKEARKLQDQTLRDVDIQIADFWFSRQQWGRAREALEPIVSVVTGERQAGLALRLAEICQNLRDYDAAEKYADMAEKLLAKTNPTIEMLRAVSLVGRGENALSVGDAVKATEAFNKAIQTFQRATELAPNNYIAWTGLADAQRGMYLRTREAAMLAGAEVSADKALALLSTYMPALRVKKDLLLDRNDLNGAVALMDGYLRSSPQSDEARRLLIGLLVRSGNPVRAITVAEDGARQSPRNSEWPLTIGSIQQLNGKQDEAIASFDRAFATEPDEGTLLRSVDARLQKTPSDWAGIANVLRANAKLVAGSPPLQGALAASLVNTKQRDAGLQALRNAYTNIKDGVAKQTYRADIWEVWYSAVIQSFLNQPKEAEAFVKATIGGQTPDFYAARGLARIWRAEGRPGLDNAFKYFEDAVVQAKDSPDLAASALIEAGEAAYVEGLCERSVPFFERAIAVAPNSAPSLNNAAYVTAKCGNAPEKAIAWAQKAVELAPQVADLQDTLGFVMMKTGKPEEALAPLQKAVTMSPAPASLLHLAEALAATGRKDEARAMLERTRSMKLNAEQTAEREQFEKTLQ